MVSRPAGVAAVSPAPITSPAGAVRVTSRAPTDHPRSTVATGTTPAHRRRGEHETKTTPVSQRSHLHDTDTAPACPQSATTPFGRQQGRRKFQSNQLQVQQGWPGSSYPYRQANQAAAAASLPPRSRQARSSQNGSTRSIHSEGGGEVPVITSMTEIAFLLTATSRFYPIEACVPVHSGAGETTVSE